MIKIKRAQSILEYAILICVVIAVLLIMQVYVKRGYQGRIKQEVDGLGPQYAPNRTSSWIRTNTSVDSVSYTGGTTNSADLTGVIPTVGQAVPDGMSVSYSKSNTTFEKREAVDAFTR